MKTTMKPMYTKSTQYIQTDLVFDSLKTSIMWLQNWPILRKLAGSWHLRRKVVLSVLSRCLKSGNLFSI